MVLIVILLQTMEPGSFVFYCINMMQGIMRGVVYDVRYDEKGPECRVYYPIIDYHYFEDSVISKCYDYNDQTWRQY
jgi:hypothetical protein